MNISGKTVAFLVSKEGIEQAELTEPWNAVESAGGAPRLISQEPGQVQAFRHLDRADSFPVDLTTAEADANDYAALVLPGGVANGDQVRTQPDAVRLVQQFARAGKPIAAICHGGWVLVEVAAADGDVLKGRTMTSWPSLKTDLRNAGADWVDQEVVVDDGDFLLISSRKPDDLPAFNHALLEALAK